MIAKVQLWGRTIGAVSLDEGREVAAFQYDRAFAASGIELSPVAMPLSERVEDHRGSAGGGGALAGVCGSGKACGRMAEQDSKDPPDGVPQKMSLNESIVEDAALRGSGRWASSRFESSWLHHFPQVRNFYNAARGARAARRRVPMEASSQQSRQIRDIERGELPSNVLVGLRREDGGVKDLTADARMRANRPRPSQVHEATEDVTPFKHRPPFTRPRSPKEARQSPFGKRALAAGTPVSRTVQVGSAPGEEVWKASFIRRRFPTTAPSDVYFGTAPRPCHRGSASRGSRATSGRSPGG